MKTIIIFLVLTTSCFGQWTLSELQNFEGSYKWITVESESKNASLVFQVEKRKSEGILLISGPPTTFNINRLDLLQEGQFGLAFRFDDEPTIYYPATIDLVIDKDRGE